MSESIEEQPQNKLLISIATKVLNLLLISALGFGGGNVALVSAADDKTKKIDSLTEEVRSANERTNAEIIKINGRINLMSEVIERVEVDAERRDVERKEQLKTVQGDLKYLIKIRR